MARNDEPTLKNTFVLQRYSSTDKGTFGVLLYKNRPICHTLEPEICDGNKYHAISAGVHPLTLDYSPRFCTQLPTIHALGRSGLRMHAGNRVSNTKGCILLGSNVSETFTEITQSKRAVYRVIDCIRSFGIMYISIFNTPFYE